MLIILVLVWAVLVGLLWGGSLWFQGYVYNEPAPELYWRAPAAASALTLFLALWCFLESRAPGHWLSLADMSPRDIATFSELTAIKGKAEAKYRAQAVARGTPDFVEVNPPHRPLPTHPDAIIVQENGQDVRFEPERDARGNYLIRPGQSLHYLDASGRVMDESNPGEVSSNHWGRFIANLLLNLVHLVIWWLCLWLLLRFQWSHALGVAAIPWLVMTLVIVPVLLARVDASPGTTPPPPAAGRR